MSEPHDTLYKIRELATRYLEDTRHNDETAYRVDLDEIATLADGAMETMEVAAMEIGNGSMVDSRTYLLAVAPELVEQNLDWSDQAVQFKFEKDSPSTRPGEVILWMRVARTNEDDMNRQANMRQSTELKRK